MPSPLVKINDCINVTWHFLVATNTCLHMLPLLTQVHLRLYDPQRIYLNGKKRIFLCDVILKIMIILASCAKLFI